MLLTYVAFALARDNKDLLIGEAAEPRMRRELYDHLGGYAEIDAVAALYTMRLGTRRLLVAARLDLSSALSSDQVEDIQHPDRRGPGRKSTRSSSMRRTRAAGCETTVYQAARVGMDGRDRIRKASDR